MLLVAHWVATFSSGTSVDLVDAHLIEQEYFLFDFRPSEYF